MDVRRGCPYSCLIQALGVFCYPKGRWDSAPVSVNDDPGRLWNWADNPNHPNRTWRRRLGTIHNRWCSDDRGWPATAKKLHLAGNQFLLSFRPFPKT
jgi:hypothetical protein